MSLSLGHPETNKNISHTSPPKLTLPYEGQAFRRGASQQEDTTKALESWQKDRSGKTLSPLLKTLEPQIRKSTQRYAGAIDPIAMGKAKKLVIDSLDRYDPQKASIETYIDRQLQPLMRWQSRRGRQIRLPDRMQMDAIAMRNAAKRLEDETGREPSTRQIADHTGLTLKRIEAVRKADQQVTSSDSSFEGRDGGTMFADDMAVFDDATSQQSWLKMIRDDLDPIDQVILERTVGLDGATILSNKDLSARLKLSPGAISQRKARIQKLLDQESELSPFL